MRLPEDPNPARSPVRPRIRLSGPVRWLALGIRAVVGVPARALRGTARVVGDPARQVFDYWVSERITMRQGFVAVSIAAVTSLMAGVTLAAMEERLADVSGLLLLIPVSIGMRGSIFGSLAARLGTAIHSGLFQISTSRDSLLVQNVYSAAILTATTSVVMGLLARGIAWLLHIDTVSAWDLVGVAVVGGLVSSAVVLAVTVYLSVVSFRKGWDLDAVGAPLITAIGDVVTLPSILLASFLVGLGPAADVIGMVAAGSAALVLMRGWNVGLPVARRIVRESFPVLSIAIVLGVLAGAVIEPRLDGFLQFSALLIVIPGFLENTGALGAILAARLGSKLHLGAVSPTARPQPVALLDATIVLALGAAVYALTAVSTLGLAEITGKTYPGAFRFVGVVMLGGILATALSTVIGYYGAIATFRFGLDPDNHTIPVVTAGMDLLGIICLVIALLVFGVA